MPWFVRRIAVCALALAGLAGCGTPTPEQRLEAALGMAARAGWQESRLAAGGFRLLALHPAPRGTPELAVFIEGDGFAWVDPRTPSADPTPTDPVALRLALAEPHRVSAYLGRPCQFEPGRLAQACHSGDWTQARFSPAMVEAMDQAVSQLKQLFGAGRLVLVGYSGGGTLAALLAARRTDVTLLVTVAAVLDHAAWTRHHGVSPLVGSLNPAAQTQALRGVRQIHFVGGRDTVSGQPAVQPYLDRLAASDKALLIEVPSFNHQCCWVRQWPLLSPP